jgi:hypothetical protein
MTDIERQIGENIKKIAAAGSSKLLPGKVTAVDSGKLTCTVISFSEVTDTELQGVRLNTIESNLMGVVLYPAVNSIVWVTEVGEAGSYGIVRCSEVTKIELKLGDVTGTVENGKVYCKQGAGELTMQEGKLQFKNGSGDLKTGVDNLLDHLAALTVPTAVGPSGPPINVADFIADKTYVNQILF